MLQPQPPSLPNTAPPWVPIAIVLGAFAVALFELAIVKYVRFLRARAKGSKP